MNQREARLRASVDQLHEIGIGKFINLPEIAVMGDTSSGKSSLLGNIAKIEFPSNAEITTRCPMRLRMEHREGAAFSATVSISWNIDSSYKDEAGWLPRTTQDRSEVTQLLAQAQEFIIECAKKPIAFDIVEISVTGDDCVDVTLIDLPGIVRSVSKDESTSLIADINALIQSFLINERCIILAIVPANVDFHNSQIMADAEKVDPETRRTKPVITKPDTIDPGSENAVRSLLLGEKKDFSLGFHMVKCRGQKALDEGVTIEKALEIEQRYFRSTKPWSDVNDKTMFGIENLKCKLADIQVGMIEESMPSIRKEVDERLDKVTAELLELGDVYTTDASRRRFFSQIVKDISTSIKNTIQTSAASETPGELSFCADFQTTLDEFGATVEKQRLGAFRTEVAVNDSVDLFIDGETERNVGRLLEISSDGESVFILPFNTGDTRFIGEDVNVYASSSCSPFSEDSINKVKDCYSYSDYHDDLGKGFIKAPNLAQIMQPIPISNVELNNDWLLQKLREHRNNDLQCFLSARLFSSVVKSFINEDTYPESEKLLTICLQKTTRMLNSVIERNCPSHFPNMLRLLTRSAKELLDTLRAEIFQHLGEFMNEEMIPYTQNHQCFELIQELRTQKLKQRIFNLVSNCDDPRECADAVVSIFEQNEKMSMEEHSFEELKIILQAYGTVATKRIIDRVPMILMQLLSNIDDKFYSKMSEVTDSQLQHMLDEKDSIHKRRMKLLREKELMEQAKLCIDNL